MAVTKHKLTNNPDKITGGSGADLFLAPLIGSTTTLTGDDVLNGGGGMDEIRATLGVAVIAPEMKNIERGIFTFNDADVIGLDLVRAAQMKSVTLTCPADLSSASVEIANAAGLSSLTILNGSKNDYEIAGLDAGKTKTFRLTLDGTVQDQIGLYSLNSKAFTNLDITLKDGVDAELAGDCLNARNLAISSGGSDENTLVMNPGVNVDSIRNLTVTGTQNLTLYNPYGAFLDLKSFNSTEMSAITWVMIGGDDLTSVRGGKGAEIMDIASIGGEADAKAKVSLGAGHDYLTLKYAFDATTQVYDGGAGTDTLVLTGAAADVNDAARNFENIHVKSASGLYDVTGMKLVNFLLFSTSSVATIEGLASDATLGIYADTTTFLTVNVAEAVSSTTDSLRLLLQNSATLGSAAAGFMAPSLSKLQIDCFSGDHVMYLGSVGSATDGATVEITGDNHLDLNASNGSTSYIASLVISSDAGADISGLANGTQAFVATGATITGGKGDDVLVGGAGADTISTGAGDNIVHGSLGADAVTLGSGADTLVFTAQNQSSYGAGHDTIDGFDSAADLIDLSGLGVSVFFRGTVPSMTAGLGQLSVNWAGAFFNSADDTLYIDIDRDMQITAADMQIVLTGVDLLTSSNFDT